MHQQREDWLQILSHGGHLEPWTIVWWLVIRVTEDLMIIFAWRASWILMIFKRNGLMIYVIRVTVGFMIIFANSITWRASWTLKKLVIMMLVRVTLRLMILVANWHWHGDWRLEQMFKRQASVRFSTGLYCVQRLQNISTSDIYCKYFRLQCTPNFYEMALYCVGPLLIHKDKSRFLGTCWQSCTKRFLGTL